jgi:hypothetical protein
MAMDATALRARLRDALVTIPAVWTILIGTGFTFSWLQPGMIGALLSLVTYTGLLFAWGQWTGPGRRTVVGVYLLAGLLYLALMTALLFTVHPDLIGQALSLFGAGLAIGFQMAGGPDTPGEYYFIPMLFNLFGPILVMGLMRHLARRDQADRA